MEGRILKQAPQAIRRRATFVDTMADFNWIADEPGITIYECNNCKVQQAFKNPTLYAAAKTGKKRVCKLCKE